jgi:hypothetical protein
VYLSSPKSQMQADKLRDMPVLLSFAVVGREKWLGDYVPSFSRLLLDSGAYSEFTGAAKVSLDAYAEWAAQFPFADGVAALDDIRGDWERGMENWRRYPAMFPTFHNSDPDEALDVILGYQPRWLGLGMVPPGTRRSGSTARWPVSRPGSTSTAGHSGPTGTGRALTASTRPTGSGT